MPESHATCENANICPSLNTVRPSTPGKSVNQIVTVSRGIFVSTTYLFALGHAGLGEPGEDGEELLRRLGVCGDLLLEHPDERREDPVHVVGRSVTVVPLVTPAIIVEGSIKKLQ